MSFCLCYETSGKAGGATPVLGLGVKPVFGVLPRRLWVSRIPKLNVCDVDYTTPQYTRRVPVALPGKCGSSGGRAVRILLWRRNSRTWRCQSSLRRILWRDGHRPSCSAGRRPEKYTAISGQNDGSRPWDDAATRPYLGHLGPSTFSAIQRTRRSACSLGDGNGRFSTSSTVFVDISAT